MLEKIIEGRGSVTGKSNHFGIMKTLVPNALQKMMTGMKNAKKKGAGKNA